MLYTPLPLRDGRYILAINNAAGVPDMTNGFPLAYCGADFTHPVSSFGSYTWAGQDLPASLFKTVHEAEGAARILTEQHHE